MTAYGMTAYEELRQKQVGDMIAAMPSYVARLSWSRVQLELHRRRAFRLLLRVAMEYSPWHRERLKGVDPATATEADLERIPPMTRDDLMDHWDEIVIYPSIRLEAVEAHLDGLEDDAYLFDSFHAVASGGACGRRGIFLYDWDAWIASFAGCARWRLCNRARGMGQRRVHVAMLTAGDATHFGYALNQSFALGGFHCFPASLSLDEIVRGLNSLQPDVLNGYPSVFEALEREVRGGRLRIRPAYVNCSGEPLPDGLSEVLRGHWGARVNNAWSASEAAPLGQTCSGGPSMHLADDLLMLEPVDALGRPVEPGERSAKVYLTNLFNLALPLIRYELTDEVTLSPGACPCGSAYTTVDEVGGRFDDRFVYPGGVSVDPAAIGLVLNREKSVIEYQVWQTEHGADVRVRCDRGLHLRAVGQRVASALCKRGVSHPSVSVQRVDSIERLPTGKLRRFVPAPAHRQGGIA